MAQTKSWKERQHEHGNHKTYGISLAIGAVLLLLGIFSTLDSLGWKEYWPVALIVAGLAVTFWAAVNRGRALTHTHLSTQ